MLQKKSRQGPCCADVAKMSLSWGAIGSLIVPEHGSNAFVKIWHAWLKRSRALTFIATVYEQAWNSWAVPKYGIHS